MEHVTHKVFSFLDLNSRIELGLTPRRIPREVISNFESKFPRPHLIYNPVSRTLYNFFTKPMGMMIFRPIDFGGTDDDLSMFNPDYREYVQEIICDCGEVLTFVRGDVWYTELKIKFVDKGDEGENSVCTP